jgi:hypothetical protein
MSAPGGLTQAEFEAELDARGFEPTERTTAQGRLWRKKGRTGAPPPHLHVPHAVDGYYPDWLLWQVRRRIASINNWMRPRLVTDDC